MFNEIMEYLGVKNEVYADTIVAKKANKAIFVTKGNGKTLLELLNSTVKFEVPGELLFNNEQGVVFVTKKDDKVSACKYFLIEGKIVLEENANDFTTDYVGRFIEGDYNAVILLGNSKSHSTLSKPMGNRTPKFPFTEMANNMNIELKELHNEY